VCVTSLKRNPNFPLLFFIKEEKRLAKEEEKLAKLRAKEEKKRGKMEAKALLVNT
jgi:hypothetical protein